MCIRDRDRKPAPPAKALDRRERDAFPCCSLGSRPAHKAAGDVAAPGARPHQRSAALIDEPRC
eukprot:97881-Alexandrium_andersonii.AAC.1